MYIQLISVSLVLRNRVEGGDAVVQPTPAHIRPRENMVGVNMALFSPCLNLMYSARTMLTPTMISRRRHMRRSCLSNNLSIC